jgi:hypothetical protein
LTSGVSEAKAEHSPTDNVHAVLNLEKEPGSARLMKLLLVSGASWMAGATRLE